MTHAQICGATYTEAGREGKTYVCGRKNGHPEETHRANGSWVTWAVGVKGSAHEDNRCTEAAPEGVAHLFGRCELARWHNGPCNYEAVCGESHRRNHQREIWFTHGGTRAWQGMFDHKKHDMVKVPMKFSEALEMIDTGTAVVVPCAFWERKELGYV